jgi:tRNA (adenine22-N1)-methyltransferase
MITLSKRLEAIASLITPGHIVADVGTDHGYIPIYQIQQNRSPSAIAMDLREGPLQRAREHIQMCGLSDRIHTRLSDGTAALGVGEADTIVVAGMGGELVLHILTDGEEVCRSAKELILQPQSEIAAVRRYLREHAYRIAAEDMVFEDGKYYPMMRVIPVEENEMRGEELPVSGSETRGKEAFAVERSASGSEMRGKEAFAVERSASKSEMRDVEAPVPGSETRTVYDLYGELLLKAKHPVLQQYLTYQEKLLNDILDGLRRQPDTDKIRIRIGEIEKKLEYNQMAQHMLYSA